MEKQDKEERSGSDMPSQCLHEQGCHGGHTYTHPTLLSPMPPHTFKTIRPEPMELGRSSKQTPEWSWMYALLLSAPTGVLFCLNMPTPSQATQATAELLCL